MAGRDARRTRRGVGEGHRKAMWRNQQRYEGEREREEGREGELKGLEKDRQETQT